MPWKNTPPPSLYGIYETFLDTKWRCAFPSELRKNAVNASVYLFHSSLHKRLIATLDKEALKQKFPDEFASIPLQEKRINKQWKIFLWWKLLKSIGIDTVQKGSKISFIPTSNDNRFIEIHFSDETIEDSIRIRMSIANSVASKLLTQWWIQSHFSINMVHAGYDLRLDNAQMNISPSTFTINL